MTRQSRPFGLRDKLGYLFGDFGNDFTFILSTTILMKFYTDVMGVSAGAVGTIMMLARLADGFTDVTMGRICDRSRIVPGVGKFRPWILRMCVPVAAASFLMYLTAPAVWPYGLRVAYLLVTYLLWGSVFYTAVNIPYGSMASAISPEPGDRQSLSTFRTMGGMLAGMIIGASLPLIAYQKVNGVETLIGPRVTLAAGVFSLLAIVCYLLCYALTTERVTPQEGHAPARFSSVADMLRGAVRNRALISIIAASVLVLLAQLTMQNMAGYVYPDYYNNASAQSASTLLMMVAMLIAAIAAKPLTARFGKAEVSAGASLLASLVCLATFLLKPGSVWTFVLLQTLCWLGLGVFSMVCWALITDVIDYAELQNGIREDGSVYALYSFARKLGQAVSAGVSGWLLTLIGYVPGSAAQSGSVLSGVFTIATLVPAFALGLLAAVLALWYPLHRRQVEENVARLKEKHSANG